MNAKETKSALNGRAEEFVQWLLPAGTKIGQLWRAGSIGGEPGQSLSINISGAKTGAFFDFATGTQGGNLLDLYIQVKRVPFKDALHACANWLGVSTTGTFPSTSRLRPETAQPTQFPGDEDLLSPAQCRDAIGMVEALKSDRGRCEQIARERGWRVETIQKLTNEASLGYHDEKLVFVYETGVKFRWQENGARVIRWAFGKPWIWRGGLLRDAETIYLCEGETDAISLIDAGIEERGGTVAAALPSATTFNPRWAESFTGKDVILLLDADAAGVSATERVSKLLAPCTRSLAQLDWKAIQYAAAS